ncbi:MAG TPA: hypothetical protein VD839_08540 [Burkholderiales bacterium]|nr:hypothetical protein [Burkholderiales bacterium]
MDDLQNAAAFHAADRPEAIVRDPLALLPTMVTEPVSSTRPPVIFPARPMSV